MFYGGFLCFLEASAVEMGKKRRELGEGNEDMTLGELRPLNIDMGGVVDGVSLFLSLFVL